MENILAVAAAIVRYAAVNNQPVNCFELQQLLVRLQQVSIEETGQKCFCDEFEHWRTGPVFRSVWEAYREWGREPILHASEVSEMRLVNMRIVRIPCTVSETCRERTGRVVKEWKRETATKGCKNNRAKSIEYNEE